MATPEQQEQLIALTTMMFNAPPGATFLAEFEGYLDQGLSIEQVAINLSNTDAFNAQFDGMTTDKEKIDLVLAAVGIDEQSDAYEEAFTHFQDSLNAGVSPGTALQQAVDFLTTTEDETFSQPSATFRNKVETGVKHSIELGLSSENLDELKSVFEGVTDDPATLAQKQQALEEQARQEQSPEEEGSGNGGGGGGTSGPTFTVTNNAGDLEFGGTATGAVTLTTDGLNLTFTRENVEATTKPGINDVNPGGIPAVTMTATTHDTTSLAAKLGGEVTLTTAFSGTAGANATGYILTDDTNSIRLVASGQNVTGGTGDDTVIVGMQDASGTYDLGGGANVLIPDYRFSTNGPNISGVNKGEATTAESLTLAGKASVTMTAAQNNSFTGTVKADWHQIIHISDASNVNALENIEKYYILASGKLTVNSVNTAVDITVKAGAGDETVDVAGLTVNGNYNLGDGVDVLMADNGANISGVNSGQATTAESLTLVNGATITMTAAQNNGFTGTVTAEGTETITISNAGTISALENIEIYKLSDTGYNTITLADNGQTVNGGNNGNDITGGAGNDIINGGAGNDIINGGEGADVITSGSGNDGINLIEDTSAKDTVIYEATAVNNSQDTITGFDGGSAATADVLDFTAFFAGTTKEALISANANPGDPITVNGDSVVILSDITGGEDISSAAGLTAALNGGEYANFNAIYEGNTNYVFLTAANDTATLYNVLYANSVNNSVSFSEVTSVGTVSTDVIYNGFDAANFA